MCIRVAGCNLEDYGFFYCLLSLDFLYLSNLFQILFQIPCPKNNDVDIIGMMGWCLFQNQEETAHLYVNLRYAEILVQN